MSLYDFYLDTQDHKEEHMRDEHAESDPEALVREDTETDSDPDEANPHANGEWYSEWNGPENEPPQDAVYTVGYGEDSPLPPNIRDDYSPTDVRREQLRREFAAKHPERELEAARATIAREKQPPRGVPNPPTNRPNYTGD